MPYFYSKTTSGFYNSDINEIMPNDCVEISDEFYAALLNGQSEGKVITADADGFPLLADPNPPSQNAVIMGQIFNLEATVTPRRLRDAQADDAGGSSSGRAWMKTLNEKITELRSKMRG